MGKPKAILILINGEHGHTYKIETEIVSSPHDVDIHACGDMAVIEVKNEKHYRVVIAEENTPLELGYQRIVTAKNMAEACANAAIELEEKGM